MPNCTQTGSHAKMRPSSVTRLNLKVYNVVEVIVLKMYRRQSTDNNLVGPCELPFNAKKKNACTNTYYTRNTCQINYMPLYYKKIALIKNMPKLGRAQHINELVYGNSFH